MHVGCLRCGGAKAAKISTAAGCGHSGCRHNASQHLFALCAGALQVSVRLAVSASVCYVELRIQPHDQESKMGSHHSQILCLSSEACQQGWMICSAEPSCRKIGSGGVSRKREAMAYFSIESAVALALSLLINVWVVSVFARGFAGDDNEAIGLENAGTYLGRRFGEHMKYIWAIGLLAAGVFTPVFTSSITSTICEGLSEMGRRAGSGSGGSM